MNEELLHQLNDRLEAALTRGKQVIDEAQLPEAVDELKVKSEQLIREHPIKSLVVGFTVGFILARLFTSEDD
ncbi:MAG: hypothetical protein AAFW89_01725 [Bacteroidota bacterium]